MFAAQNYIAHTKRNSLDNAYIVQRREIHDTIIELGRRGICISKINMRVTARYPSKRYRHSDSESPLFTSASDRSLPVSTQIILRT